MAMEHKINGISYTTARACIVKCDYVIILLSIMEVAYLVYTKVVRIAPLSLSLITHAISITRNLRKGFVEQLSTEGAPICFWEKITNHWISLVARFRIWRTISSCKINQYATTGVRLRTVYSIKISFRKSQRQNVLKSGKGALRDKRTIIFRPCFGRCSKNWLHRKTMRRSRPRGHTLGHHVNFHDMIHVLWQGQ